MRTPKWEDLDDLLELINSLVEEGVEITKHEKFSREAEIDWPSKTRKMGLKVLTLSAFSTNKRALHVYEKMGLNGRA